MQLHRTLSTLLVVSALAGAPVVAWADPAPIATQTTPASAQRASAEDRARYAAEEQQAPAAASFEAGGNGVYIGGGALTVLLIVLLVVILL